MTRDYTVMPPEQAVLELVEKLTAYENRHRDLLAIANTAAKEIACRKAFDGTGSEVAFLYLTEARADLVALVEEWQAAQGVST